MKRCDLLLQAQHLRLNHRRPSLREKQARPVIGRGWDGPSRWVGRGPWSSYFGGLEGRGEGGEGVGTPNENLQMGSSDGCSPNRRQAEVPLTIAAEVRPAKRNHGGQDGRKGVTWVIDLIELSCIVDSANKPNLERRR